MAWNTAPLLVAEMKAQGLSKKKARRRMSGLRKSDGVTPRFTTQRISQILQYYDENPVAEGNGVRQRKAVAGKPKGKKKGEKEMHEKDEKNLSQKKKNKKNKKNDKKKHAQSASPIALIQKASQYNQPTISEKYTLCEASTALCEVEKAEPHGAVKDESSAQERHSTSANVEEFFRKRWSKTGADNNDIAKVNLKKGEAEAGKNKKKKAERHSTSANVQEFFQKTWSKADADKNDIAAASSTKCGAGNGNNDKKEEELHTTSRNIGAFFATPCLKNGTSLIQIE